MGTSNTTGGGCDVSEEAIQRFEEIIGKSSGGTIDEMLMESRHATVKAYNNWRLLDWMRGRSFY